MCGTWVLGTMLWLLWPVLGTAFVADDISNSQRSAGLAAANESLIDFTIRLTRQWMTNEGRFFPVSVFENALLFDTIHSRFLYKLLQVFMVSLLVSVMALFVWLMTHRRDIALLTMSFFCVAIQVRFWYDPTISFGVLLPSTGIKALAALCCVVVALRREKRWESNALFGFAAVLWLLALMQYEIVLLLSVVALFAVLHESSAVWSRRVTALLSIGLPSLIFVLISRIIRSGVTASPAYETNLAIADVARALKYQILGAVPLSVPFSGVDDRSGVGTAITDLSNIQIGICIGAVGAIAYLVCSLNCPPFKTRMFLLATAISFFTLPAVPTSLSVRWQTELGPGHSYLPVMLQYLGTAVMLLFVTIEIKAIVQRLTNGSKTYRRLGISAVAIIIGMLSISIVVTNRAGIEYTRDSYAGFKTDREIFEAATKRGLLEDSLSNGILLSSTYDPALWLNREYISWLGGPVVKSFGRPKEMFACQSTGEEQCSMKNGALLILEHTKGERATVAVVTLKNWWTVPSNQDDVLRVTAISSRREDLLCGQSEAEFLSGWWTTKCLTIDEALLQKIQSHYAS